MGADKASLLVDGTTLAERTAELLSSRCRPAIEVGPGRSGLPAVVEPEPGSGPLAAMAAGSAALGAQDWTGPVLVVATDLPRLSAGLVGWLAGHAGTGTVLPVVGGRVQPLCGRWSAADLARIPGLLAAGSRSVMDLVRLAEASGAALVDAAEWSEALEDVDTAEDLKRLGLRPP